MCRCRFNTVVWSVNVAGGNSTYGTISSTGLYQAPQAIPVDNAVTVRATSTAYPAKSGAVTLTITQVQPRLWGTVPTQVSPGGFTLTLNGAYCWREGRGLVWQPATAGEVDFEHQTAGHRHRHR